MIFKEVLIASVLSVIVVNIFGNSQFVLQSTEYSLRWMRGYLTAFQSYIREKRMEIIYENEAEKTCPLHSYRIRIVHRKPLIIYIEKFLTEYEINHIIGLAEPLLKPSMVTTGKDGVEFVSDYRTSSSAYINGYQTNVVECVKQRFAQFQGYANVQHMEPFQVVKYVDNQQSGYHYDWFHDADALKHGGQRISTFFTYLRSNCSNGETEFTDVPFNRTLHEQFCDILTCNEESHQYGIRFRPLPGNSVFWYNLDEHGKEDRLTYHVGLPPGLNGHKIGLNTWTREKRFQ